MKKYLLITIVALLAIAGGAIYRCQQLKTDNERLHGNQSALMAEVERLGIKANRLQTLINTSTHTTVRVDTIVKDSVVYLPLEARLDTLKCFEYNDGWVRAHGCIDSSNHFEGEFESRDSLLIVAHRVPKRFLFFRWGCKRVELDIKSSNPHSEITHAKYVEFAK